METTATMTAFDSAFAKTGRAEGVYSNDPNDAGGETKFGITKAEARAHGYTGAMRDMPLSVARQIMRDGYWDLLRLDSVAPRSQRIAEELFDSAINMGVGTAGRFLQRALNVLNRGATDYPDLTVDGVVGPMTVFSLGKFLDRRGPQGETVMLRALNALQGARYVEIAENKPSQEGFEYGWFNQRVAI